MKKRISGILEYIKLIFIYGKFVSILLILEALVENANIYFFNSINMVSINMLTKDSKFNNFLLDFFVIIICCLFSQIILEILKPVIKKNFIKVGILINYNMGKQYMKLPYYLIENPTIIDKVEKALRAVNSRMGISKALESFQSIITSSFSVIIWGYSLQKKIKIVIALGIIGAIIFGLNEYYLRIKIYENDNKMVRKNREQTYYLSIYRGYEFGKEIRANKMNKVFDSKIGNLFADFLNIWKRENEISKKNIFISGATYILLFCVIIYFFLDMAILGKISIGEFSFYFGITTTFLMSIKLLISSIMDIYETGTYFSDYSEFNKILTKHKDDRSKKDIKTIAKIEFQHVSFKYPGSEIYVLRNISFVLERNESVAIVGINGCGKTTIINLLLGLYQPSEGDILINNISLGEIKRERYTNLLSAIFQEDYLFAFSIWKNITLSQEKDSKRFKGAVSKAQVEKIYNQYKNKENTVLFKKLDEKGLELSGGESKRVCCARAMYKEADVLICDEVTASLDIDVEKQIYNIIHKYCENKIVVFVSHKIKSTLFCKKIIVLQKGTIEEIGSPEELITKKGMYYEMYKEECYKCKKFTSVN